MPERDSRDANGLGCQGIPKRDSRDPKLPLTNQCAGLSCVQAGLLYPSDGEQRQWPFNNIASNWTQGQNYLGTAGVLEKTIWSQLMVPVDGPS